MHKGQEAIESEAVNYFRSFFKSSNNDISTKQVEVVSLFTRMINGDEERDICKPVTLKELKLILSLFKKDKSLGLDG